MQTVFSWWTSTECDWLCCCHFAKSFVQLSCLNVCVCTANYLAVIWCTFGLPFRLRVTLKKIFCKEKREILLQLLRCEPKNLNTKCFRFLFFLVELMKCRRCRCRSRRSEHKTYWKLSTTFSTDNLVATFNFSKPNGIGGAYKVA